MPTTVQKSTRRITVVFWFMLGYILAALVWWYVSLEQQNQEMGRLQLELLQQQTDIHQKTLEENKIRQQTFRNTTKYVSEGITFLILILVSAFFVYSSVRRRFRIQLQQENFTMAVTHELKTPISVARLNLETLKKYTLDDEKRAKLMQMTLQELARLDTLTNNILVSSQMEGQIHKPAKELLNFSELVQERLNDFRNRFPERKFAAAIDEEISITGDAILLQMMVNNLLENAIKYSPKEQPVKCSLRSGNGKIFLAVRDHGAGIPEEEKRKVFEKFYRSEQEATRKTKGTGLGLYLCSRIAAYHNADISINDPDGGGTEFLVRFNA